MARSATTKTRTGVRANTKAKVKAKPKTRAKTKSPTTQAKEQTLKITLPGRIYQRGTRWWWCTELPGDDKPKARPLKAAGDKAATEDRKRAEEIALEMWEQAIRDIAQRQVTIDADRKVAKLKAQFLDKVRDFTQVIERTTAKLEAEKEARIEAEAKLEQSAAQPTSMDLVIEPTPMEVTPAPEPDPAPRSIPAAAPEPPQSTPATKPVPRASCQCCHTGDIPVTDLTQIDSGQFLCPDCLAALRVESQAVEPPQLVACRSR